MFDGAMKPPPKDADAATLARHRADMAAQMATKLATLADATAKLQGALTPEQAKTLADMTRHPMGGRHGGKGGSAAEASTATTARWVVAWVEWAACAEALPPSPRLHPKGTSCGARERG